MATKNDKVILNLQKDIETKTANIRKAERFQPITNCNLELYGTRYNINVLNKYQLQLITATLKSLATHSDEDFIINGFVLSSWITDLESKFATLTIQEEKSRLEALKKKLHDLLSIDTKVELEINDIMSKI